MYYGCKFKRYTDEFDRLAQRIADGNRKNLILTYMKHENFQSREATFPELQAIRNIARQEDRENQRRKAEANLAGS